MIVMLFQKRRGVNVKAKLKLLEVGILALVMILDVYLINLNMVVSKYETSKKIRSTANYIEVEAIEEVNSEIIADSTVTKEEGTIEEDIIEEEPEPIKEEDPIIYDGKTLDELASLLDKSLNSTMSGKGYLIASYSLENNVDPYMATAIMLHETGCRWECSRIVRECNNVGGQKGTGCGSYGYFNSLDEGIMAFIDNLNRNYISYGLTTPEEINPKYAEDTNWSKNVNKYIEIIKAQ